MRAIFYHSVIEKRDPSDYYTANAIEIREFEIHVAELARNWRVLSLYEVAEIIRQGRPFPKGAVHISFDDGFGNNLYAAEILDRYKLPWTVSVVVDAILDGFQPWYMRLADAITATNNPIRWRRTMYDLSRFEEKWRLAQAVKSAVLAVPAQGHLMVLDEILAEAHMVRPEQTNWPFLSLGQLQQLSAAGVEIGNHSARHANLVQCCPGELSYEVGESQRRLEAALNRPIRYFCYPDGQYNASVMSEVSASHELALAGWNSRRPLAPFELRRYSVGPRYEDLLEVLSPVYPVRFRYKRLKWMAKRNIKKAIRRLGFVPTRVSKIF